MNIILLVWVCLQVLIGYNLVLPLVLYLFYSLKKKQPLPLPASTAEADYAIIVPAYQQITFIPAVVASLLKMNYSNYIIYIVADDCDISSLHFDDPRIVVLRPEQPLANHISSHFYAIHRFKRPHERLTLIDSDNLVHPEYLNRISAIFDQGYSAVQGTRSPRNLNTTLACLDGARDIYYHFYDGEVLFQCGSSSTLAGSGMAFTTKLYRECMEHSTVIGAGFDKVLQFEIIKRGYQIAFEGSAIVYDEKTSQSTQLVKQRARWINTWFSFFTYGFVLLGKGIRSFNWNQTLFGVILLRPPLFLFLLSSILCLFINLFISPVAVLIWVAALGVFGASFFIALLHNKTDKRIYQSLRSIPRFIYYQVKSLLKMRKNQWYSVATEHFTETRKDNISPDR
jgi:cellulose synthase/poly-beta-1,6-N-acetylglucosamine synthase-like glycosyltransferase